MRALFFAAALSLSQYGYQASAQSSISIAPSQTTTQDQVPAASEPPPGAVVTTTTVTTTTSTAPTEADVESTPSVRPELPPAAPPTAPAPTAEFVDDGSNDTASVVARAKRRIRESMATDPWLMSSVNKISMSADGESLTLSGFVNHSDERDAIDRIARESVGSLRLINSIRVR